MIELTPFLMLSQYASRLSACGKMHPIPQIAMCECFSALLPWSLSVLIDKSFLLLVPVHMAVDRKNMWVYIV